MIKLEDLQPDQIRKAILNQLSTDEWQTETHIFNSVMHTLEIAPTKEIAKLRLAIRYLSYKGKVVIHAPLHSDGIVRWRRVG